MSIDLLKEMISCEDCKEQDISLCGSYIVKEFISMVDEIYKEVDLAMQHYGIEQNMYGVYSLMHKISEEIYKFDIFMFKDYSLLVKSDPEEKFEQRFLNILKCVHRKYTGDMFYFFSKEMKKRIISNLKSEKDFYCLNAIDNLMFSHCHENGTKRLIFELMRLQLQAICACHKFDVCITNGLFESELQTVGAVVDVCALRKHFEQELITLKESTANTSMLNLQNLLEKLIAYKISFLSESELCLMLKIYCVENNEDITFLKHKEPEQLFLDLIKIFDENHIYMEQSDQKLLIFKFISENKTNSGFTFIRKEILEIFKTLNDVEIDYLKDVLYNEIYTESNCKHLYESISPIGNYVSFLINQELYDLILAYA